MVWMVSPRKLARDGKVSIGSGVCALLLVTIFPALVDLFLVLESALQIIIGALLLSRSRAVIKAGIAWHQPIAFNFWSRAPPSLVPIKLDGTTLGPLVNLAGFYKWQP